ncbi:MAG: twin-arginine translocase subunit TatC, partial [Dehalococcoidales bacterium]
MSNDKKLTVLGHLGELRSRLIKCVIAVAIASLIAFIFYDWIFYILILPAKGINLIYIEMTEMIGTIMRVCLASGIVLAMPYLVYQGIMFVSPALSRKEKKYVYLTLPWIALMFTGGVVFGYFILVPPATRFLITFGSDIATPQIKIGNYISI